MDDKLKTLNIFIVKLCGIAIQLRSKNDLSIKQKRLLVIINETIPQINNMVEKSNEAMDEMVSKLDLDKNDNTSVQTQGQIIKQEPDVPDDKAGDDLIMKMTEYNLNKLENININKWIVVKCKTDDDYDDYDD